MDSEQSALVLKFSTDDLPDGGRVSAIRDYLVDLMRVDVSALDADKPLHYSASLHMVDGASWGTAYPSSIMSARTREHLKDGQDDLILGMSEGMEMNLRVPGREDFLIRPGDAFVLSYTLEMQLAIRGSGRLQSIRIPHRPVTEMVRGIGSAPAALLPSNTPGLPLLFRYASLLENDPLSSKAAQRMAAQHLQDMAALVVSGGHGAQEQTKESSIAAAHLAMARNEIAKNLGNTNLGLKWIAARQRITPRHLQRLFAQEGTSFSDVLRQARVVRARALLEDPRNRDRTILSIALECGFPEASALNRAFRNRFGLTPSDVRWRK